MMQRNPRLTVAGLMAAVAALALVFAVAAGLRPRRVIESLDSPVAVSSWSSTALRLADGRNVLLPGMKALPVPSTALAEATKRGVELASDGRVYGLVRVHHWCGNDPVGEHIARVDLALFLEYLGEGQPIAPPLAAVAVSAKPGGTFSPSGWDVGEYYEFRAWCGLVESERGIQGASP